MAVRRVAEVRRAEVGRITRDFLAERGQLETLDDEDHVAPNGKVQRFQFCRFARL